MAVKRNKHKSRFTVIPNEILAGSGLSAEARGILGYLLTKPPKWRLDLRDVQREFGIGSEKAYRVLTELLSAGYARRITTRNPTGKFLKHDYLISDIPLPEKPHAAEPDAAEPDAGNQDARERTDSSVSTESRKYRRDAGAGEAQRSESDGAKPSARPATHSHMTEALRKRMETDDGE